MSKFAEESIIVKQLCSKITVWE